MCDEPKTNENEHIKVSGKNSVGIFLLKIQSFWYNYRWTSNCEWKNAWRILWQYICKNCKFQLAESNFLNGTTFAQYDLFCFGFPCNYFIVLKKSYCIFILFNATFLKMPRKRKSERTDRYREEKRKREKEKNRENKGTSRRNPLSEWKILNNATR